MEHVDFSDGMNFRDGIWFSSDKFKSTNMIQDTLYFRNAIYRVLHERSYIVAFFTDCLEFPGKK